MKSAGDIVLKFLGGLLIVAAVLKGYDLLTKPVAEDSLWTSRWSLMVTVEFELALGVWLVSGLFKRAARLAGLICFGLFSVVTFYKALTGAESCGCFGSVHVNPWITLFVIDLPAVIVLAVFPPSSEERKMVRYTWLRPVGVVSLVLVVGIPAGVAMAGYKPASLNANGEIVGDAEFVLLEPKTWVGKEPSILRHIDIGDQLKTGSWLVLLYHYDCTACQEAIHYYQGIASKQVVAERMLNVSFVEVPPCPAVSFSRSKTCAWGQLVGSKEWFVSTPTVLLLTSGKVISVWEGEAPTLEAIMHQCSCQNEDLEGQGS